MAHGNIGYNLFGFKTVELLSRAIPAGGRVKIVLLVDGSAVVQNEAYHIDPHFVVHRQNP